MSCGFCGDLSASVAPSSAPSYGSQGEIWPEFSCSERQRTDFSPSFSHWFDFYSPKTPKCRIAIRADTVVGNYCYLLVVGTRTNYYFARRQNDQYHILPIFSDIYLSSENLEFVLSIFTGLVASCPLLSACMSSCTPPSGSLRPSRQSLSPLQVRGRGSALKTGGLKTRSFRPGRLQLFPVDPLLLHRDSPGRSSAYLWLVSARRPVSPSMPPAGTLPEGSCPRVPVRGFLLIFWSLDVPPPVALPLLTRRVSNGNSRPLIFDGSEWPTSSFV